MGPLLAKRYGRSKNFSPGQVQATAKFLGSSDSYLYYCYAMYCTKEEFPKNRNGLLDHEDLRNEIRVLFFEGDSNLYSK